MASAKMYSKTCLILYVVINILPVCHSAYVTHPDVTKAFVSEKGLQSQPDISKCSDPYFLCDAGATGCQVTRKPGDFQDLYKWAMQVVQFPSNYYAKFEWGSYVTDPNGRAQQFIWKSCWQHIPWDYWTSTLQNGEFLWEYPLITEMFGKRYKLEPFRLDGCYKGTWLTCQKTASCTWIVPLVYDDWKQYKEGMGVPYVIPYDTSAPENYRPVHHCYPCLTGVHFEHYNFDGNIPCTGVPSLDPENCKSIIWEAIVNTNYEDRVFCPGGKRPPQYCPLGAIATTDKTGCMCPPGKYDSGSSLCVDCPVAHYCLGDSLPIICKDGTYQDQIGQSECKPCVLYSFTCRSASDIPANCSKFNDPVKLSFLTSQRCVPCLSCKNSIIEKDEKSILAAAGETKFYYDCMGDLG